jgi:hypothetical protein
MTTQEEQNELLQQAVNWLRFQSIEKAKAAVDEHLNTDAKKRVYELTDGLRTCRAIEQKTGIGKSSISNWWNLWHSAGILVKNDDGYKKLFSLSDLGLETNPTTPAKRNGNLTAVPSKKIKA